MELINLEAESIAKAKLELRKKGTEVSDGEPSRKKTKEESFNELAYHRTVGTSTIQGYFSRFLAL